MRRSKTVAAIGMLGMIRNMSSKYDNNGGTLHLRRKWAFSVGVGNADEEDEEEADSESSLTPNKF